VYERRRHPASTPSAPCRLPSGVCLPPSASRPPSC
jgi:hypothetical protein